MPQTISLEVTNDHPVPVEPSLGGSVTVTNVSGSTLFYADTPQVLSTNNQGSLTAGQSTSFSVGQWLRSAGLSSVTATVSDPGNPVSGVASFNLRTGAVTPTSGDYTAALVTNTADKSSVSQQAFTGEVQAPDFKPAGLTGATAAGRYVGTTATGAPASGTFILGDWVTDQAGKRWTCTVGGSPGTWAQEPGTGAASTTSPPPPANGIWNFMKCRVTGTGGGNNGYARAIWNFDSTGNKANVTEGMDMWWGGLLYLRTGEMSLWQGQVDFWRWDNFGLYTPNSQDWLGFVREQSDAKFRLQLFNQQGLVTDLVVMSAAASLPSAWEGAWHRVECHTTIHHTDGSAFNEIWVDGVSQGSSTLHNLYSMAASVTYTNSANTASSAVNSISSVPIVPGLVITGVTGLAAGTTVTAITGAGPYTLTLSNSFTGTTGAQSTTFLRPYDRWRAGVDAIDSNLQTNPVTMFHAMPYYDRQQRGTGTTVTTNGRQALFQSADLSEFDGGANTQNGAVEAEIAG